MKTYNVVLVASVEWETEVEADSEEQAMLIAEDFARRDDIVSSLKWSGGTSNSLPEAIEAWEVRS
jgi:hypothetical protein